MAKANSPGTTKRPSKAKQPTKTKTPSKTVKGTEETASAHLSNEDQLRTALPLFFMTLAWTYLDGGGDLTTHIINSYLPSRALELAQSCGLTSASEAEFMITASEQVELLPLDIPDGFMGPDEAAIGVWCVSKYFKEDFMRLIEKPIANLTSIAATEQALRTNPTAISWKRPTPKEHIDRFLKVKHWSKVMLINKVSGIDNYICEATKQFLKRLYRPPETTLQARIDSRTYNRLERLLAIMSTNAPQQFGSLRIEDLRWTSIDFNA
jgi:hypothetical protein